MTDVTHILEGIARGEPQVDGLRAALHLAGREAQATAGWVPARRQSLEAARVTTGFESCRRPGARARQR